MMEKFDQFYEQVTGFLPFPWQSALAERVSRSGKWPSVVDIPTGGGKTGILLIGAWLSEQGLAPRRLAWVIDRRIVVDQVRDLANQLIERDWDIITLRGGVMPEPINPSRRTIIASTVDQVGSRMLWQPYGQNRRSAAIHAGLILEDCMIFLDEAHISRPFLDVVRHLKVPCVEMTATPQEVNPDNVFRLDSDDLGNLERRMTVPKEVRTGEGLVVEAKRLKQNGNQIIGVICNTAKEARSIHDKLRKVKDAEAILITGRQRHFEREQLLKNWLPFIQSGRTECLTPSLFVVATSAIEVGADLDFDAMVTECPAQDALYQRLGRCNRTGRNDHCEVVVSKPSKAAKAIYGEAASNTWNWLSESGPLEWPTLNLPQIPDQRRTPVVEHPVLMEANRIALMLARLEIGPYLHGWSNSADINLVWRADLPPATELWREIVSLCPPATGEQIAIPFREAVDWIGGRDVLIWSTDEDREMIPGDVIVIPSSYGGMDQWGWNESVMDPVPDVAEKVERRFPIWRFPDWELTDDEASEEIGEPVKVRQATGLKYTAASPIFDWRYKNESLAEHTDKVVNLLTSLIDGLDDGMEESVITPNEREALIQAAYWHDQGKSHPTWQTAAHGHPFGPIILGKTERLNVRQLRGFRHDRESAQMACNAGETDLVQSLAATHHGRDIPRWLDVISSTPGGIDRWAYLSSLLRFADQEVEQ